jgi:CBS domain containing-hemolysin-like protein
LLFLALFIALAIALSIFLLSIAEAVITLDDEDDRSIEALTFARMSLLGIFGIVVTQSFTPGRFSWYWVALMAVALVALCQMLSQVAARKSAKTSFGRAVLRVLRVPIRSLTLLFTPLKLPTTVSEEFEQELIDSVEEFGETIAREVMVPRIDMATIDADASLEDALDLFLKHGHSRLPVIKKNADDVKGILYLKDVVRLMHEQPEKAATATAKSIARTAIFVPESKPVDDLLQEMQVTSTHIAMIVDEYGGVAGLATMEDVIEEIVGDIADEYDRDTNALEDLGDGTVRALAVTSLFDLGEHFGLELEDEDVDSVGGFMAKQLGRLPGRGDAVESAGLRFETERFEGRRKRLITVLVTANADLEAAKAAFEEEGK